jgi:hypothetical protein
MTSLNGLPLRDLETLSAYLDGELAAPEAARLEARLEAEPALKAALDELRATSQAVRSLPALRVPRNFTLTPQMAGIRPRRPAYPMLRLAAALATIGFVLVSGLDVLSRGLALGAGAPAPSFETARLAQPPAEQGAATAPSATQEAAAPAMALGVENQAADTGEVPQTPIVGGGIGGYGGGGPEETIQPPAVQAEGATVGPAEGGVGGGPGVVATATPTGWGIGGGPAEAATPGEDRAFAGTASAETHMPAPTATSVPLTETLVSPVPPSVSPIPATLEGEEVPGPTARTFAGWGLLRWAEIVLGGAAVILSVFSLRLRRNR